MSKKVYNDRTRVHLRTCSVCHKSFKTNLPKSSKCYACYPEFHRARIRKQFLLHEIDFRKGVSYNEELSVV
jgi:hypothetical protein